MADLREAVLVRLLAVYQGVEGIAAAARNATDVPGLARPALLLHDGAENQLDKPDNERQARFQRIQMMPETTLLVGAQSADVGTLHNLYRARLVKAVVADATDGVLFALLGASGEVKYDGCQLEPATAESKEGRMMVNFVFTYPLRISDL